MAVRSRLSSDKSEPSRVSSLRGGDVVADCGSANEDLTGVTAASSQNWDFDYNPEQAADSNGRRGESGAEG